VAGALGAARRQEIGFPPPTQPNYHASGEQTNRACCRSPFTR
jgi:hypothetical protein